MTTSLTGARLMDRTFLRLSVILVFFMTPDVSLGQGFTLGGINYSYYPSTGIKEANSDRKVLLEEKEIFANIPLQFQDGKMTLINGFKFGILSPQIENNTLQNDERDLYHIGYSLSLIKAFDNDWLALAILSPSISSDFKGVDSINDFSEQLLFQGSLLFQKTVHDDYKYGFGGLYTSKFGSPLLLPLAQLSYKKDRLTFDALIPAKIGLYYDFSPKKFTAGLQVAVDGGEYEILDTINNPSIETVRFSQINFGPKLEYRLTGPIHFSLSTGFSTNRKFEFALDNDNSADVSPESNFFLSLGLSIKPILNK